MDLKSIDIIIPINIKINPIKMGSVITSGPKITAKIGVEIKESKNIVLKNIDIIAESGPAVKLENYENVTFEDVSGEIVR